MAQPYSVSGIVPYRIGSRRSVDRRQDVAALLVQSTGDLERTPGTSVLQVSDHVRHALTGFRERVVQQEVP